MIQKCCWSLALMLVSAPLFAADWGNFSGQLTLQGEVPKPVPISIDKDAAFCGRHGLKDESLVIDVKSRGIANVVIYLYQKRGSAAPEVHPSYEKKMTETLRLDNKNCRYEPHVLLLHTGQPLLIGNRDAVGHNSKIDCLSNPSINFNIPTGGVLEHSFEAPERLPVQASCSIHAWMKSWIVVKDNPYMGVTDKDGKFTIENMPAGEWTFQFWHERAGYVSDVVVDGKPTEWTKGRLTLEVKTGENDLGTVQVPLKVFED